MASQRIPGPEGCSAYPQLTVDDGTLARASTWTPGINSAAGDTWKLNSLLSAEEMRAIAKITAFCKEMEEFDLINDLESAVADEAIDFGEVENNNHAAWNPVTQMITVSQNLLTQILYPHSLDSAFRNTMDLTALLAHELKHQRQSRLTWVLDSFADPNRSAGARWASYGAWGLMWQRSPAISGSLSMSDHWTSGSINRFEQSVWQVGLQKRLNWAQHEYQRLEQLQMVNASRGEQIGIARRVQAICDDFLIYHHEALSLSSQMNQLKLTATNGKEVLAVNARQEVEHYANVANRIIQGR